MDMEGIKIELCDKENIWKTYYSYVIPRIGELVYVNDKRKWFKVGLVIHDTDNGATLLCKEVDIDKQVYYG